MHMYPCRRVGLAVRFEGTAGRQSSRCCWVGGCVMAGTASELCNHMHGMGKDSVGGKGEDKESRQERGGSAALSVGRDYKG